MPPEYLTNTTRAGHGELYRVGQPHNPALVPRIVETAPAGPGTAHQGRGSAALYLADRIIAQARAPVLAREDVTPEMEPESPSITTEETDEDFTDNEDVTPDMEPYDATIESSLGERVTVSGDENSVTITAEDGETIVAVTEDDHGNVEIEVEDTSDVLLSP
jgi:hypothetical protein